MVSSGAAQVEEDPGLSRVPWPCSKKARVEDFMSVKIWFNLSSIAFPWSKQVTGPFLIEGERKETPSLVKWKNVWMQMGTTTWLPSWWQAIIPFQTTGSPQGFVAALAYVPT